MRPGLFLGVAILAGCGGGSTPPAEQPATKAGDALKVDRTNPCSVLVPSEITEIFGVESTLREVVDDITCHYHFESAGGTQLKSEDGESFIRVQIHWTEARPL